MTSVPMEEEGALMTHFRSAVAEDLRQLASLQEKELTKEVLTELKEMKFPENLGLHLQTLEGKDAFLLLQKALEELPYPLDEALVDDLAADFASIYLNNSYHASPYESVWVSEEGLMRQAPMMQVRGWYQKYDLLAKDWQKRADDYLALQLEFVAHLMALDDKEDTLRAVARFLDEHPLRWIKPFATRVINRCATPFYAGVVLFTVQYLEEVRELLAKILQEPRPSPEEIEQRMKALERPIGVTCAPVKELVKE